MSEFEPVATVRHVHIREQNIDLEPCLQQDKSLGGIGGFDYLESCIFKKFGDEKANERFIFN